VFLLFFFSLTFSFSWPVLSDKANGRRQAQVYDRGGGGRNISSDLRYHVEKDRGTAGSEDWGRCRFIHQGTLKHISDLPCARRKLFLRGAELRLLLASDDGSII